MKNFTRRQALEGMIVLPALAGLLAATTTMAEAKGSKSQFKYQTHPKGSHKCSNCSLFIPGTTPTNGSCKVVAGSISANGWCIAYSAK